jgi:hypothetical protein
MTILCETVESLVTATNVTVVETIFVNTTSALARNTLIGGVATILISAAAAVSTPIVDHFSVTTSTAAATSTPTYSASIYPVTAESTASADEVIFVVAEDDVVSTANATGVGTYTMPPLVVVNTAAASSTSFYDVTFTSTSVTRAKATSTYVSGIYELVTTSSLATNVITGTRVSDVSATNTAAGQNTAYLMATPQAYIAVSAGVATSTSYLQAALQEVAENYADASDSVWYRDPYRLAWVVNTETTAASWYTNYDFDSVVQVPGKELAVGPDGLYVLTGATDAGTAIKASIMSGFDDFGTAQTKRLDSLYFGYTSAGQLSVSVETYGSGHAPSVYLLEQRTAAAPRNSRVIPGKGLVGRYWRTTIENTGGVDFDVYDTSVDIAESTRRV